MNSFEVNTLPYTVHTLLTYKTKDKYKGFIVKVMEDKDKKRSYFRGYKDPWKNRKGVNAPKNKPT